MFMKTKIYGTVLAVYEIFAVLFLHFKNSCSSIFTTGFCLDSVAKYFIFCVALPILVFLLFMWIGEIRKYIRRRHSLLYRAKSAVQDMASELKDRVTQTVSPQYIEKLIAAMLLVGVRKYADKNPKAREILTEIIGFDIVGDDVDTVSTENPTKQKNKKKIKK